MQMLMFCYCAHIAAVVPDHWANIYIYGQPFIFEVHPPAGAVNMNMEPQGLSFVVFCCTAIK